MGVAGLISQLRAQWTLGDEREGGETRECDCPPPPSPGRHKGTLESRSEGTGLPLGNGPQALHREETIAEHQGKPPTDSCRLRADCSRQGTNAYPRPPSEPKSIRNKMACRVSGLQGAAVRTPVGSCRPVAVLILDERRTEFQLTTASGKNTSQPSKTPTVALGPSGNPGVLQQRYLLGPACSMGVQW